jgi:hypothetical protein
VAQRHREGDPLGTFEDWIMTVPDADLGDMLKEYVSESNHQSWDGWDRRHLTAIRRLFEDMKLYWENRK